MLFPQDEYPKMVLVCQGRYKYSLSCRGTALNALGWLAPLVTHIPNKGESAGVRDDGFYSNKLRGLRKKAGIDDEAPALIDSDKSRQAFRKNWACLIQKFYNVELKKIQPQAYW